MGVKKDLKNKIAFIKCKWGKGKCHFCGFEGLVAIVLERPPDLCTCGKPVEAICWKCLGEKKFIFDKEPISIGKKELKLNEFYGECELCGFKGKIWRLSRPMEGYAIYTNDHFLGFKDTSVQQICDTCLTESIANAITGLLERPNDPQAQKTLKQLKRVLRKHGYELVRKSRSQHS